MNRWMPLALALLIAGCGGMPSTAPQPPLAGARIGGPFTLVDQTGRTVTDATFAGRYRIVYFGYTFCPDVCPVDVQVIAAGLKAFAASDRAAAAKVVPIFVTVDPARDTPAVLKAFVGAFDPRMVGLTGTAAQVATAARAYGVYFAPQKPAPGGGYMVDHTRTTYLIGPKGEPIALLPTDKGADAVAAELRRWVK